MNTATSSFQHDECGATSSEYAILISLIAAVIILSVGALGIGVNGMFDGTCDEITAAATGATC